MNSFVFSWVLATGSKYSFYCRSSPLFFRMHNMYEPILRFHKSFGMDRGLFFFERVGTKNQTPQPKASVMLKSYGDSLLN